jgi:hypothetical protein
MAVVVFLREGQFSCRNLDFKQNVFQLLS